jgi:uncharacterized protein (TIGR03435 family)
MYRTSGIRLFTLVLACLRVAPGLHGQIAGQGPRFDSAILAVSHQADRPTPVTRKPGPGNSFISSFKGFNLSLLIQLAYHLSPQEYVVTPTVDTRFDGTFQYPAAKASQFSVMLQNLLIDRLGMKTHWSPREIDAFVLESADGGIKMKAANPQNQKDCKSLRSGATILIRCTAANADDIKEIVPIFMDEEALGHLFLNRTALEGVYDFSLEYTGRGEAAKFNEALQQQLGLKLTRRRQMTQILIVDYVTVPTTN